MNKIHTISIFPVKMFFFYHDFAIYLYLIHIFFFLFKLSDTTLFSSKDKYTSNRLNHISIPCNYILSVFRIVIVVNYLYH